MEPEHYAAPVSPLDSVPVTTGGTGACRVFPRPGQGEYKGSSVRSLPPSPAPSLWTGRSCQQLPAPSHHTALHVPTGSDRLVADRSTQHSELMRACTHTYTRKRTPIHTCAWLCPVCLQETLIQICTVFIRKREGGGVWPIGWILHLTCIQLHTHRVRTKGHHYNNDPLTHKMSHCYNVLAACDPIKSWAG